MSESMPPVPDENASPDHPDTEEFCGDCFAGLGSSEHHEKCLTQRYDCDAYCMVPFGSHHPRCGVRG